MSRNAMSVLIAVLVVVAIGLGYYVYRDQQKSGIEVTVGDKTLSIEGK